ARGLHGWQPGDRAGVDGACRMDPPVPEAPREERLVAGTGAAGACRGRRRLIEGRRAPVLSRLIEPIQAGEPAASGRGGRALSDVTASWRHARSKYRGRASDRSSSSASPRQFHPCGPAITRLLPHGRPELSSAVRSFGVSGPADPPEDGRLCWTGRRTTLSTGSNMTKPVSWR